MFDKDEDEASIPTSDIFVNEIEGKDIIQLKNNTIPKVFVPLEELLDNNDVAKNPIVTPNEDEVDEYNIGTDEELKFIKLSKSLTPENKKKYIELMK